MSNDLVSTNCPIQRKLERKQSTQKKYYDKSSKSLAVLAARESIRIQQQGK